MFRREWTQIAFAAAFAATLPFAAAPTHAADMSKVIRHVFPAGEEGFDPAAAHDLYSGTVEQAIFETLLTYDYLARPAKLVPLTAEALPQVTDNGQTYTLRIRKGIYFTPDPAFKGVRRELVADDYVYSWKRLMDPKIRSPWTWLLDGVRHRHRAPQRDLVVGEAADDGVHQVPVMVGDLGIDKARQADAFLLHVGRQRAAIQDLRRERALHVHEVELAVLESEEARLVFLHDADLDPADLGHLLALHLLHDPRVLGVGARLEIPDEAPVIRTTMDCMELLRDAIDKVAVLEPLNGRADLVR